MISKKDLMYRVIELEMQMMEVYSRLHKLEGGKKCK